MLAITNLLLHWKMLGYNRYQFVLFTGLSFQSQYMRMFQVNPPLSSYSIPTEHSAQNVDIENCKQWSANQ